MSQSRKDFYTSHYESPPSSEPCVEERIKAKSEPAVAHPAESEGKLEKQVSAPSYLFSLNEKSAPPFRKPEKEPRPKLLIGRIITRRDVVEMVATAESDPKHGLKEFLEKMLVQKQIVENFNLSERDFLVSLLTETIGYAAQRDFNAHKLAVLMTIYLATHIYFKWYYWSAPVAIWKYFRELMIRHTIEDSPDGEEVFQPDESYDIITHFHTMYISNLPLVHILTFGVYRLKFSWPFKKAK